MNNQLFLLPTFASPISLLACLKHFPVLLLTLINQIMTPGLIHRSRWLTNHPTSRNTVWIIESNSVTIYPFRKALLKTVLITIYKGYNLEQQWNINVLSGIRLNTAHLSSLFSCCYLMLFWGALAKLKSTFLFFLFFNLLKTKRPLFWN